jgi:hypothetical protein
MTGRHRYADFRVAEHNKKTFGIRELEVSWAEIDPDV